MTQDQVAVMSAAAGLRDAFDRCFAAAPSTEEEKSDNFLGIRIGGDPHAVALADIAGLFADRKTVALPGRAAELLGIAGLRGEIVPVYSLRAFLGYPPAEEPARWLLLASGVQAVSFAFDRFDGFARVPHSQLSSVPGTMSRGHVHATATIAGVRRSIISVHSIMTAITSRTGAHASLKEH